MLIFYPFLKCYNVFGHIPYFLNGSAAFDIKGIKDILSFCTDCILICDIISDCPHLLPVELFGVEEHSVVQVSLINVKVHHTWVRSSDLCNVGVTESSSYLSSLAPVFDLSLNAWISAFYNTCDNSVSLASSLKVCNSFSNSTAGIAFTKPCSNVCVIIIQSFQLLNVYQNNRNVKVTDCRQHIVGCSVGQHLKENKVNVCCTEFISCNHRLLFGCYHSSINDLYSIRNCFLKCFILSFKLRYQ